MRESKPLFWALLGAAILAAYGIVAALQPISEFGRVYAAYDGIFIALSLAWGVVVDGFRPDRYDLLGALICVAGVVKLSLLHPEASLTGWPNGFLTVSDARRKVPDRCSS